MAAERALGYNWAYGRLDRCRTGEGGKIFWKFFDPGF